MRIPVDFTSAPMQLLLLNRQHLDNWEWNVVLLHKPAGRVKMTVKIKAV